MTEPVPAPLSGARARQLLHLRDRKGRVREGRVLVEGPRAVDTAATAGAHLEYLVVSEAASPFARGLAGELSARGIDLALESAARFADLCDTENPQGILAVAREPTFDLPEPGEGAADPADPCLILVLDAVQDPGNAGTLVRSAAAFGVERVIALDGTVDLWNPKAVRASAGHAFSIPLHRLSAEAALDWLRATAISVVLAEAGGDDIRSLLATSTRRSGRRGLALVIGNEGAGPRPLVAAAAELKVALRLAPGVDSLNAGVAGTVLLWCLAPSSQPGDALTPAQD